MKIKDIARVAVVLMLCALPALAKATEINSGGQPYYSSGVWYSLYYHNSDSLTKTTSNFIGWINSNNSNNQPAFTLYTPTGTPLTFDYYIDKATGTYDYAGFKVNWGNGDLLYQWATDAASAGALNTWNGKSVSNSNTTRTNIKFINNGGTGTNGAGAFINNVKFMLARHIYLDNGGSGTSGLTIDKSGDPIIVGQAKKISVPFRSFLTNGDVTVSISGDAQFTLYDPTTNTTGRASYIMLTGANQCGVKGGAGADDYSGTNHTPGNATLKDIVVWYTPTAQNATNSATITISDGTSTATASISASTSNNAATARSDGKPYFQSDSSKWLSLFVWNDFSGGNYIIYNKNEYYNFSVYPPCELTSWNTLTTRTDHSSYQSQARVSFFGNFNHNGSDCFYYTYTVNGYNSTNWYHPNVLYQDVTHAQVKRTGDRQVQFNNFVLKLARHARLVDANNIYGSETLNFTTSSQIGTYVDNTFYLRSFLTTTNLRMRLESEDASTPKSSASVNDIFQVSFNSQTPDASGYYTITTVGNICGYQGASGNLTSSSTPANPINTNQIPILIQYRPDSVETRKAKLVFYDGSNVVACIHLSGTGLKQQITLNWLDATEPQVIDGNCVGNYAECVSHPEIQVYYTSSDTTLVGLCDEDPNHSGNFRKIYGRKLDTTATITAYILPTSTYELQDSISKSFRVSSKLGQTIVDIADYFSYPSTASSVNLAARAVLSSDTTVATNMPITYAIENATSKSGIVTLTGSTLTFKGVGEAVLIVTAAGDETYEQCVKRINIEVYDVAHCPTQYLVNQSSVSGNAFWKTAQYVFQQTYTLTKPAGKLKSMSVETNGNIYVTIKYTSGGNEHTVCDYHCGAATGKIFENYDLPRNTSSISYKIYVVTATLNYSVSALQVTQAKYFDEPVTKSVAFGNTQYKNASPIKQITATPYSALDVNEISYRIEGDQASSFSLENPTDLKNLDCAANEVLDLNLQFTPQTTGTCNATLILTATVDGVAVERSISLSGNGILRTQTLNWNGTASSGYYRDRATRIELKAISNLKDISGNELPIAYTSADNSIASVAQDPSDGKWYLTMHTIGSVKITASQAGDEITNPASIDMDFQVLRDQLIFVGTNGENWQDASNWNLNILPDATSEVTVNNACSIPDGTTAYCYSMTINQPLTVNPNAVLNAGVITNTNAANLLLKADADHQATVMLSGGDPDATIECYFKGTIHPDDATGKNNPDWQYRGFIGKSPARSWGSDIIIFKWDESANASNCWNDGGTSPYTGAIAPWEGYCMANYNTSEDTYTYTSQLIPTDQQKIYTLTRTENPNATEQAPNCGVNLITNSWSAPLDMTQGITFAGGAESTFYIYKTCTHNEFDDTTSFITYPEKTGWTTNTDNLIPAGQSFLVRTNTNGGTLTVDASALSAEASGAMYAPRHDDFNVLRIILTSGHGIDRLTLIENDNCSSNFDNGYDGTKMMQSGTTQLYAANSFGNTAVNSDRTMLGQLIGCTAAQDGERCTITFETDMLTGFDGLYLFDRTTRIYTDILRGDSYSFNASAAGDAQRFEILGRRDDGTEYITSADRMIEVIGNRALLSGFSGTSLPIYITDLRGNRLWTASTKDGTWFDIPTLHAGVYVIYCDNISTKFVVK